MATLILTQDDIEVSQNKLKNVSSFKKEIQESIRKGIDLNIDTVIYSTGKNNIILKSHCEKIEGVE